MLNIIGGLMVLSVFAAMFAATVQTDGLSASLKIWGLSLATTVFLCIGAALMVSQ